MADLIKGSGPIFKQVVVEEDFMGGKIVHQVIDYSDIVPKKGAKGKVTGVQAVGISMRYIDPNKDGKLSFRELYDTYGKSARGIFDFMRLDMVKKYPPYERMTTEKGVIRTWDLAWLKLAVDLIAWKHGLEIPNDSFSADDKIVECVPPPQKPINCSSLPFYLSQISAKCFLQSLEYLDYQIKLFNEQCKPGTS